MSETSKAFLLSALSGIVAFGAAVLVLGGEPQPRPTGGLTRADVQAMLDSQPRPTGGLTRADVQAMLDSQPRPTGGLTRADVQAMLDSQLATGLTAAEVQTLIEADSQLSQTAASLTRAQVQTIFDLIFDLYYAAHYFADCSSAANLVLINDPSRTEEALRLVRKCIADAEAEVEAAAGKAGLTRTN